MRKTVWMFAAVTSLVIAAPAMALDADSPAPNSDHQPWARWQGRLWLGTPSPVWRPGVESSKVSSASVMGDYYFGHSLVGAGNAGGFRATSGVIFGPRTSLSIGQPGLTAGSAFSIGSRPFGQSAMPYTNDTTGDNATLPYLGVGYTNLAVRSGWSFSADLGLVAQTPGSIKMIRSQSLDDAVREMRLAPLLQLGVSYAF